MSWYNPHVSDQYWKNLEEESPEWWAYWEEQIERCLSGYQPPERPYIFIEGRYYFVLNFCLANTDEGWIHPMYLDYQGEFFEFFEDNDSQGINTGMEKARRKGFTFIELMGILYYDMIFYDAITDGLCVGDDETLTTLRTMLWEHIDKIDSFFRLGYLTWNKNMLQFGYIEKDKNGRETTKGTGNKLRMELMSKNTEVFKGTMMTHIVFEEIGKFKKLRKSYGDSVDCLKKGAIKFGSAIFGGTGGNVEDGSADFMYMHMHPNEFNLKWTFVTALKGLAPFINRDGVSIMGAPTEAEVQYCMEKYPMFPEEQIRLGSQKWWDREEANFKSSGDKTSLYQFYQNNPIKTDHIFLTKGSGIFNQVIIDEITTKLQNQKLYEGARRGTLRFVENWREIYNLNGQDWCKECVEFVPDGIGDSIMWDPPNEYGSDLGALDPYAQEESVTSDSIGVIYIFRTKTNLTPDGNRVIFKYSGRPAQVKTFNLQCFLAAIFYDIELDVEPNMGAEFIAYVETMKGEKYLKLAPKEYDEFETKAKNKYGRRMSVPVKKIMVSRIAEYIEEYWMLINDLFLAEDLKYFGTRNTDHAFAFGLCIMDAYERYAVNGLMNMMEEEDQPATSLITYKRVNGQIVAIVK